MNFSHFFSQVAAGIAHAVGWRIAGSMPRWLVVVIAMGTIIILSKNSLT
jgi:hypothetical protein